ncbi:hypothetical protein LNO89_06395 [Klebsiella pneumoniae subsp. pneumoniae]|nr:hypothetical protein [Klebsiella pneumoniae subsp. pneumoniae]
MSGSWPRPSAGCRRGVLPSPEGVLKAFWTLSGQRWSLWQHLAISSWRALVGFAIGGSDPG